MNYPLAADEQQRLESLHRSCLLDTPAEERFDRLTRLARRHFEIPVSMITLLDSQRQWFKSAQGHLMTETPRELAFCNYTILDDQPLVVPNALLDQRFFDNPVVRGEEGVRFYAGVPLRNEDGHRVGTFCLLDVRERHLDAEALASLDDFAACAESELQRVRLTQVEQQLLSEVDELRRKSLVDPVTRCWTRETILEVLEREKQSSTAGTLAVLEVELDGLTALNQTMGTEATDRLLRLFCEQLRTGLSGHSSLGRLTGGTFLVVLTEAEPARVGRTVEELLRRVVRTVPAQATCCAGAALWRGKHEETPALLARVETSLSRARRQGSGHFDIAV